MPDNTSPEPTTQTSTPAAPVSTPAAPSIPEPSSGGLDFFSAIEKQFSAAENPGEKPTKSPEPGEKPEEKPVENAPEKPDKPTSPKARDFELIKTQRDEARSEAQKLQATLKELQDKLAAAEAATGELPSLREKLSSYETKISAVDVEASPEYAELITKPATEISKGAERLSARYKIDKTKMMDAFAESDPSVQNDLVAELASTMNPRDQFQFYQLVDDFNAVMAKRADIQSRAQEAWKEIQQKRAKEQESAKEAAVRQWKEAEAKVWSAIEKRVPNAANIPNVQNLRNQVQAKSVVELSTEEQAYSAMAGLLLPHIVQESATAQARIKELETSLAKYVSATPGAGAGGGSSPGETADDISGGGFLERIERRFAGA